MKKKMSLAIAILTAASVMSVGAAQKEMNTVQKPGNTWIKIPAISQIKAMKQNPLAPKPTSAMPTELQAMVAAQLKDKAQMEGALHQMLQDWRLADTMVIQAMQNKDKGVALTPEMNQWLERQQALTFKQSFKDNLHFCLDDMANKMQWKKGNSVEKPGVVYSRLQSLVYALDVALDRHGKAPVNFPYLKDSISRIVYEYDSAWNDPLMSKIMYTLIADAAHMTDSLMAEHMPMSVTKAQALAWQRYDEERAKAYQIKQDQLAQLQRSMFGTVGMSRKDN